MLKIAVKGAKAVMKEFEKDAKQMGFAVKNALNQTAYHAAQDQKKVAANQLDEPTPFTLRGFKYQKATTRDLQAAVYVDRIQAKYLQWQVYGGRRPGRSSSGEAVPATIALNKYGNIVGRRAGKIKKLIDQPDTFIGTIKGKYGLWQRGHVSKRGLKFSASRKGRATSIRLLVRFVPFVDYPKLLKFHETADKSFYRRFDKEFDKAYRRAMETAR